jgi:hypothetical protein
MSLYSIATPAHSFLMSARQARALARKAAKAPANSRTGKITFLILGSRIWVTVRIQSNF